MKTSQKYQSQAVRASYNAFTNCYTVKMLLQNYPMSLAVGDSLSFLSCICTFSTVAMSSSVGSEMDSSFSHFILFISNTARDRPSAFISNILCSFCSYSRPFPRSPPKI